MKKVQDKGFDVFLDLKFHDIPVTTAKACKAAANLGVWMLNVHALGGVNMMKAAVEAIHESNNTPKLIAVTMLTSHSQQDIEQVGITTSLKSEVLSLAALANDCGLDGVVCSAQEAMAIKQATRNDFLCVTPGIRPVGSQSNDQKRIVTPEGAVKNGASYLVIGRPITQASNPELALQEIAASI